MEDQVKKVRGRTDNFNHEEVLFLVELISDRASVIEDKSATNKMRMAKATAWLEIKAAFEVRHGKSRTLIQIKDLWKRTKINAKKEIGGNKREMALTGGGKNEKVVSILSERVMGICPQDFKTRKNPFDSDARLVS